MGVIIDTSIWVDVERGRLAPADVAAVTGQQPVYLAPPVVAELEYGVLRAATAAQRNRRASSLARIKRKPCRLRRDPGRHGPAHATLDRLTRKLHEGSYCIRAAPDRHAPLRFAP